MGRPGEAVARELGEAVQRYQRSVQSFDDAVGHHLGLGPADMRCLDWLADGPSTASELARAAGVRRSAATVLIDRLAARGLVERVRSEQDRRKVLVRMTDEGRQLMMDAYGPLVTEASKMVTSQFTSAELQTIRRFLDATRDLTDQHRARVEHP